MASKFTITVEVEDDEDDLPCHGTITVEGMPIWNFPVTESGWFCGVTIDGKVATKRDLTSLLGYQILPISDIAEDGTANIQLPEYLDLLLPSPTRDEDRNPAYQGGTMKIGFEYDTKRIEVEIEFG